MKNVTIPVKRSYECDCLVVGGGVSGFSAAVAAARGGASVMLMDAGGFLGGTATKGLVGPFMTCYDAKGKTRILRGFYEEFVNRMVAEGGAVSPTECPGGTSYSAYRPQGHIGVAPFDVECFKRTAEAICREEGIRLLYHTTLIACDTEDGKITTVYGANPEEVIAVSPKVCIDTTGNAALTAKAGGKTMYGDEEGFVQTSSMFFRITDVEKDELDEHMAKHPEMRERYYMDAIEKARKEGRFPCNTLKLRIFEEPNGIWSVNMAQVDEQLNDTDSEAVVKAEIDQRQQIKKIFDFIKAEVPSLRNIRLLDSGEMVGIRESRRMVGKYILTREDLLNRVHFEDRIAVCANSIDIHQKTNVSYTPYSAEGNYTIPLRSLVSENIRNLFGAGKVVSADKYAFAAIRVMPPCFAMGEAAGTAAAIAAKRGIDAGDVPHEDVQKILLKNNGYLE